MKEVNSETHVAEWLLFCVAICFWFFFGLDPTGGREFQGGVRRVFLGDPLGANWWFCQTPPITSRGFQVGAAARRHSVVGNVGD